MAFTLAELTVMSNDIYTGITEQSKLPFLASTRWSTEAAGATSVVITSVGDITFNDIVNGTPATTQSPTPTQATLSIDHHKDFWVPAYDTQRLIPGFVQQTAQKAAAAAALLPDALVLSMATKANFSANWIAGSSDAAISFSSSTSLAQLDTINEVLAGQNVPEDQRFVCLPPKLYTRVLQGIRAAGIPAQESTDAMFQGRAIKVCGLNIIQSNQYAVVTGSGTYDYRVLFGHTDAIACAYLPVQTKQQDINLGWGVNIGGKVEYGAKVINAKFGGAAYFVAA